MADEQVTASQTAGSDVAMSSTERLALKRIELSAAPIGRMINVISLIAGVIAVAVIGAVIVLALTQNKIPSELSNWGGIILGFYFGQFINLVKDYTGILQRNGGEAK